MTWWNTAKKQSLRERGWRCVFAICFLLAAGVCHAQVTIPPIPYPLGSIPAGVAYSNNIFGLDQATLAQLEQEYAQLGLTLAFSFSTSGTLPPGLTVDSNGLLSGTPNQPGDYAFDLSVTVTVAYIQMSTQVFSESETLNVTLSVTGGSGEAAVIVDPSALTFSFNQGVTASTTQLVTIRNPGGQTLTYNLGTTVFASYLFADHTTGQIAPYSSTTVDLTVDPSKLTPGTLVTTFVVQVSPSQQTVEIPIVITVNANQQSIQLSQTGLQFQSVQGGAAPPAQTIQVLSTGSNPVSFSARVSTLSGGQWLSVSPPSGTSSQQASAPLSIQTNPAGLNPGTYYGQVSVSSDSATNSLQVLDVVLTVASAQNSPGPLLSTTGLLFVSVAGGADPDPQTVTVSNPSPTPLTVSTSAFSTTPSPLFTIGLSSSTVTTGTPVAATIQASPAGMGPGVYQGEADLTFTDGSTRRIAVVLVIVPGSAGSKAKVHDAKNHPLAVSAGPCTPTKLVAVFTQLGAGFNVSAGWPVPIEMLIADDCGAYLNNGSVSASFSSGDPALTLTSLQGGQWANTWSPSNVSSTQVTVTGTASEISPPLSGSAMIGGGLMPNPTVPMIGPGGIVSAASVTLQPPASPGGFISIYGTSLSTGQFSSTGVPYETNLGDTQVYLAGQMLPLQIAFGGQINAVIPYANIPIDMPAQLFVQQSGQMSTSQTITIAAASPAIFTDYGTNVGIIQNFTKNYQLVDATHPASAGDVLIIYASGLGAVANPPAPGGAAIDASSTTISPVTVTIGGQSAPVYFSGLNPGNVGLYQINSAVPAGVTPGTAVPIVVNVAGQQSTPVTINIQ